MPWAWESSPGEGWLNIFPRNPQWMQIRPRETRNFGEPLPTYQQDLPGDVGTAETCFRELDGWISCVLRDSIWADQKRSAGLPEVPQGAAEFIPPVAVVNTRHDPPPVVSSGSSTGVPENAEQVAIEWGTVFQGGIDLLNTWGQSTIGINPPQQQFVATTPMASPAVTPGGSCGCNSNPCVCGTINGRPALVDPRTGKRCYRRRRRVMLTEGDFNTLLRIATLPNNANVRTALAKAIGRR